MLIERARHEGIRRGETTLLFRRWRHRRATAGKVYRTAVGRIAVDEIDVVRSGDITADDAARAGYASAREVVADLRGDEGDPIYRLRIRLVDEPDPRNVLASTERLSGDERRDLDEKLARLDRSRPAGPWTQATLRMVQRRPAVRAGDLAEELGHDPVMFKGRGPEAEEPRSHDQSGDRLRALPRGRAYLADG